MADDGAGTTLATVRMINGQVVFEMPDGPDDGGPTRFTEYLTDEQVGKLSEVVPDKVRSRMLQIMRKHTRDLDGIASRAATEAAALAARREDAIRQRAAMETKGNSLA